MVRIDSMNTLGPDVAVNCAPLALDDVELNRPTVIFEVAVSSRQRDLGEKRLSYFRNPHVAHYVVVTPEDRLTYHWRRGEGEPTVLREDETLVLEPEPGISLPAALFFARL